MGKMTVIKSDARKKTLFSGKKGQGIGQVFVFIVAGLTFAFVMIFGYKAISDFLEKGESVEFLQFKNEIESSVKQIASEYGSMRKTSYFLPAKYEQICFLNLDAEYDAQSSFCEDNFIACDIWETASNEGGYNGADENVFLTPPAPIAIKVHKIELDQDFLCVDITGGSFEVRLEGKGSRTKITSVR